MKLGECQQLDPQADDEEKISTIELKEL